MHRRVADSPLEATSARAGLILSQTRNPKKSNQSRKKSNQCRAHGKSMPYTVVAALDRRTCPGESCFATEVEVTAPAPPSAHGIRLD